MCVFSSFRSCKSSSGGGGAAFGRSGLAGAEIMSLSAKHWRRGCSRVNTHDKVPSFGLNANVIAFECAT